jgi:hypothetical protein
LRLGGDFASKWLGNHGTSVKGNLPGDDKEKQNAETDPLQAIQAALINTRSALGVNPLVKMAQREQDALGFALAAVPILAEAGGECLLLLGWL